MSTSRKGAGIPFVLPNSSAAASQPVPTTPAEQGSPTRLRTGVGMLSSAIAGAHDLSDDNLRLQAEVDRLRETGGAVLLDPTRIVRTQWADRHPDSFKTQEYLNLKADIVSAGGNVQPIKVRLIPGLPADLPPNAPKYELVFGSRRTQACLESGLPVLAVVEEGVDDLSLYVQMQRENRGRENLSAWEQGVSYHRALEKKLFTNALELANKIGVDDSLVYKALHVVELPEEVIGAFQSPVDIQFRWVSGLRKAIASNSTAVLAAARKASSLSPRPPAKIIFSELAAAGSTRKSGTAVGQTKKRSMSFGGSRRGVIKAGKGGATVLELSSGTLPPDRWDEFELRLKEWLAAAA